MDRLTRMHDKNKYYFTDDTKIVHILGVYAGDAIDKLAVFENIYEDLLLSQEKISLELEKLRNEDKTRSVQFKELMSKKLTNSAILTLFESYGL